MTHSVLKTPADVTDGARMELYMLKREPLIILLRARTYLRQKEDLSASALLTGLMLNEFVDLVNWWNDVPKGDQWEEKKKQAMENIRNYKYLVQ